ncbi:hypothetical protein [Crocosphaera sp.]|uniref:hypothetical protein n=1 Tax=Crocosphaera sp. TaxID=2729996 RepID=UPI003F230341|nr:hypothetical protein [Crocosphaera sp.]
MANYSDNLAPRDLGQIPQALQMMKNQEQLQERDIEPLNVVSGSIGDNFMKFLLGRVRSKLPSKIAQTVDDGFNSSIARLEKVQVDLAADQDYDSLITAKDKEFHTMIALGQKRTDRRQGIMRGMSSIPGGSTAMIQYLFLLDENDNATAGKFLLSPPGSAFGEIGRRI